MGDIFSHCIRFPVGCLDCTAAFYVCGSDGERIAFTVQYAVDQRQEVTPGERVAIVGWNGDYEPAWDGA